MSSYDVSQLLVRLGDYDISTPFEAKHDTYKVARIVRHKGFSEKTLVSIQLFTTEGVTGESARPVAGQRAAVGQRAPGTNQDGQINDIDVTKFTDSVILKFICNMDCD